MPSCYNDNCSELRNEWPGLKTIDTSLELIWMGTRNVGCCVATVKPGFERPTVSQDSGRRTVKQLRLALQSRQQINAKSVFNFRLFYLSFDV